MFLHFFTFCIQEKTNFGRRNDRISDKKMDQHIPQDEIRRIIINDMVKKRSSIVPIIGEDTIVYKNSTSPSRCAYHIFDLAKDGSISNWPFRFPWTQAGRNINLKMNLSSRINEEKQEDSFENFLKKRFPLLMNLMTSMRLSSAMKVLLIQR